MGRTCSIQFHAINKAVDILIRTNRFVSFYRLHEEKAYRNHIIRISNSFFSHIIGKKNPIIGYVLRIFFSIQIECYCASDTLNLNELGIYGWI